MSDRDTQADAVEAVVAAEIAKSTRAPQGVGPTVGRVVKGLVRFAWRQQDAHPPDAEPGVVVIPPGTHDTKVG